MARTDTLGHFLTDVADAIRTVEGSGEAIQASDFDTRIEALSSGSSEPTSLNELNETIVDLASAFIDYMRDLPSTYETYTNQAVTLYTPNIDYQKYFIQKRSSGKYRVIWFNLDMVVMTSNAIYEPHWSISGNANKTELLSIFKDAGTVAMERYASNWYISPEYDTVNECIEKMLSNELTYNYTTNVTLSAVQDTPYIIPYTNLSIIKNTSGNSGETALSRRISQTETIVAIE